MDLRALFLNDRVAAALVTALVGGGVVAAGWFWTHALSRRRDRQLREERVGDIQRALLAEIRAHVAALEGQTLDDPMAREEMVARLMPEKLPPDTSKFLLCPMPGLVVRINVQAGDEVQEGQALATVEAMKMENILRAERKGTVKLVNAEAGQSLKVDDVIMEFE